MKYFTENFVFWGVFCHVLLQASFEDQQEDSKQKMDRFGTSWWDPEPWISEPQPPAPLGPPPKRPQPARPPAPLEQIRPPAPLDQIRPPAPLVQPPAPLQHPGHMPSDSDHVTRGGVHAEDINCMRSNGVTLLSALVIPPPEFTAQPVFEDASGPNYSPADCAMRPNDGQGYPPRTFAMHVQHFNKCGVRVQKGADGKEWISVTLRFPFVEGLRMAEDEYVMIMCRPQDRVATTQHVMDMRGTATEGRSIQPKKVFRSSSRDVACKMTLLTKGQGTRSFNKEMKSGNMVKVGQDLQIRAIVKEGDGWNYAMLKEVLVSRIPSKKVSGNPRSLNYPHDTSSNNIDLGENAVYRDQRSPQYFQDNTSNDLAQLVFSDGCRNPVYRPVAPHHPQRDPKNPLMVSFTFKAFMFQDMLDGESLRLSAKVVACAELSDCQQVFCNGDLQRGAGKKKRKRRDFFTPNSTSFEMEHELRNFTEEFELMVSLGGFSKTPILSTNSDISIMNAPPDCKLLLITISSVAILFSLIVTVASAIAIGSQRKQLMSPKNEMKMHKKLRK